MNTQCHRRAHRAPSEIGPTKAEGREMVRCARAGAWPSSGPSPLGGQGPAASRGEPPRDDRPTKAENHSLPVAGSGIGDMPHSGCECWRRDDCCTCLISAEAAHRWCKIHGDLSLPLAATSFPPVDIGKDGRTDADRPTKTPPRTDPSASGACVRRTMRSSRVRKLCCSEQARKASTLFTPSLGVSGSALCRSQTHTPRSERSIQERQA